MNQDKDDRMTTCRKWANFLVICTSLLYGSVAWPIGMGDITVRSALNEPLSADINILGMGEGISQEDLLIKVAPVEVFEKAGLERPFVLNRLRFSWHEDKKGGAKVTVNSREAIKEPYLNFILQLLWPGGTIQREYVVLLDPPVFDELQSSPVKATNSFSPEQSLATATRNRAETSSTTPLPKTDKTRIQTTKRGDSLWRIAMEARGGHAVSVHAVMDTIFANNPSAFEKGDKSRMYSGVQLQIPVFPSQQSGGLIDRGEPKAVEAEVEPITPEMTALAPNEEFHQSVSSKSDDSSALVSNPESSASQSQAKAHLKLAVPGNASQEAVSDVETSQQAAGLSALQQELSMAKEGLETQARRNEVMQEEINLLAEQVRSLKALLAIRDAELDQSAQHSRSLPVVSGEVKKNTIAEGASAMMESTQAGSAAMMMQVDQPPVASAEQVVENRAATLAVILSAFGCLLVILLVVYKLVLSARQKADWARREKAQQDRIARAQAKQQKN